MPARYRPVGSRAAAFQQRGHTRMAGRGCPQSVVVEHKQRHLLHELAQTLPDLDKAADSGEGRGLLDWIKSALGG